MITRVEAKEIISEVLSQKCIIEIDVMSSVGYVLAERVYSGLDLPPFNKSAMDGYAVCGNYDSYSVVDVVRAGHNKEIFLKDGDAVKIMTGSPVPENTGKVIMKEYVRVDNDRIIVMEDKKATNICIKGEDIKKGDVILTEGTVLNEVHIANLISSGVSLVKVYDKPSVSIVITGDELLEVGQDYQKGKIYNSNGPLLELMLKKYGIKNLSVFHSIDDRESMRKTFKEASNSDICIFTGGISVGDYDFTRDTIINAGYKENIYRVSMKPGKPLGFYSKENKYVFALPGNPVSVFVQYQVFVKYAMDLMQGKAEEVKSIKIDLKEDLNIKKSDRETFIPVIYDYKGCFDDISYNGSGHLMAISKCNAFAVYPPDTDIVASGNKLDLMLLGE